MVDNDDFGGSFNVASHMTRDEIPISRLPRPNYLVCMGQSIALFCWSHAK